MTIRFLDAATYFKGETHQVEAWEYLQKNVSQTVLETFTEKYRKTTPVVSSIPVMGLALIKEFEGCVLKAYYDPATKSLPITIGWGSTRRRDGSSFMIGNTITQKEADDLLTHQVEKDYLPSLSKIPYWNEMNDEMKSALISFAYNLGAGFYQSNNFNTITKALKDKRWKDVPAALLLYVNPGTNVEAGLRRRRLAEGLMWNSGLTKISK
jgi:lysozyme